MWKWILLLVVILLYCPLNHIWVCHFVSLGFCPSRRPQSNSKHWARFSHVYGSQHLLLFTLCGVETWSCGGGTRTLIRTCFIARHLVAGGAVFSDLPKRPTITRSTSVPIATTNAGGRVWGLDLCGQLVPQLGIDTTSPWLGMRALHQMTGS